MIYELKYVRCHVHNKIKCYIGIYMYVYKLRISQWYGILMLRYRRDNGKYMYRQVKQDEESNGKKQRNLPVKENEVMPLCESTSDVEDQGLC